MDYKQNFQQIVIENQDWLLRYIITIVKNKQTAEDILQEVFIRAYKNYDSYEEKGKIRNWLCTIARNTSLRHLSQFTKQNYISLFTDINVIGDSLQLADIIPDTTRLIDEQIADNELTNRILDAIDKLPEPQRQIVYMRYVREFSVSEVAALTNQPIGSVKSKSYYGLKKVKKHLSNYLMKGEYIMDCKESYTFLYHYGKDNIQPADRERLVKHLGICEKCKNIANALKILVPQIKPAIRKEIRHYLIAIPLENGYTLYYFGSNGFFEDYDDINKILEENDGYIPREADWGIVSGHDANLEHIAELDNEGNKIEFDLIPNPHNQRSVKVVYKKLKKVYPEFINTSVALRKDRLFTPLLEDPNLMVGKLQNHLGNDAKSGLYLAIPSTGRNILIKKGNGVIDAGSYKFAFSERYVTEDETIKLECSYLKK